MHPRTTPQFLAYENANDQADRERWYAMAIGDGDFRELVDRGVGGSGVFGRARDGNPVGAGRCLIYRLVKNAGNKISPRDLGAKVGVAERAPRRGAPRLWVTGYTDARPSHTYP